MNRLARKVPSGLAPVVTLGLAGLFASTPVLGAIDFTDWHTPSEVNTILEQLESDHPSIAELHTIGTSINGDPIRALKISDDVGTDDPDEGDVVFLGLHHAREWITVEMSLYLAEYLLTNYGSDAALTEDMNNLEIWIVPVVNPDGYSYTLTERMWRKNRRNNGDGTFGVDLNRNYGYEWGLDSGSSSLTGSQTYRGTSPFSEPETTAVKNFLDGLDEPKVLVTYHSYSELWLRPWSYTTADAPGEETLRQGALRSINEIAAVHGHVYAEEIGYTSSGETTDYLWGEMRTAAFTPELRPASWGGGGFDPPPATIIPNNEENLPAALALINDAGDRNVWIKDHAADDGEEPSAVWTGSGWSAAFWTSPDIWTVPETLDQGATVDLNVRVRNNTSSPIHNVRVDMYYTDPRISLEFPNPDATSINTWTGTVPPGGTVITVPWTTPVGTNSWGERHWCVGAVVYHEEDMPLTTQAQRTSNVGIRNFNTTEIVAGTNLIVAATNFLDVDAELQVRVDRDALPEGWDIVIPDFEEDEQQQRRPTTTIERKARLLGARGRLLAPGETIYVPVRVTAPDTAAAGTTVDVNVSGALLPLTAGERGAVGNGYTYEVVKD